MTEQPEGGARLIGRLYRTKRWRDLRASQLMREPLCRLCEYAGEVVAATVCDHVTPHRGDEALFWAGPFQSLCADCHSRHKQREEHGRPTLTFAADGWPIT